MFSATLHSEEVKSMAEKLCQNPMLVDLKVSSVQCRQQPELSAVQATARALCRASKQPSLAGGRDMHMVCLPSCAPLQQCCPSMVNHATHCS